MPLQDANPTPSFGGFGISSRRWGRDATDSPTFRGPPDLDPAPPSHNLDARTWPDHNGTTMKPGLGQRCWVYASRARIE